MREKTGEAGAAIRRLILTDLPAYKALRDSTLAAHPQAFTSDAATERLRRPDSYRARLGLDRPEGGEFLLGAWRDACLVGAVGCERDWREKGRHIARIIGMMVGTKWERLGIGRALLHECIALARSAQGIEMMTLSVTSSNLVAIGLYQEAGFVRYGSLPRAIRLDGHYYGKDQMMLTLR